MKVKLLVVALVFYGSTIAAQDSLKYDYAIMNIAPEKNKIFINYSDGDTKKLTIEGYTNAYDKNLFYELDQTIFKGIELLNKQGFDITGMLLIPNNGVFRSDIREYYFKRVKK